LALLPAVVSRHLRVLLQLRNLGQDAIDPPLSSGDTWLFHDASCLLNVSACFDQPSARRAACPYFLHEQVGKVIQIADMSHTTRLDPFDALQRALVPALDFRVATGILSDVRQLVTGASSARCVPDALSECQTLAVAAFSLLPCPLLLGDPAQLMPDNGLPS